MIRGVKCIVDQVKQIDNIDPNACVKFFYDISGPVCVSGILAHEGFLFLNNQVFVEGGWKTVGKVWEHGEYEILVYNLRGDHFEFGNVYFMSKIRNVKLIRVEMVSGRCAVFGAKTSLFSERGVVRIRKVKPGDKLLCLEVDYGKKLRSGE